MARTSESSFPSGGKSLLTVFTQNDKLVFVESLLSILLIWAIVAHVFDVADVISTPTMVLAAFTELLVSMEWVPHFAATLRRILYGFVLTIAIGTTMGIAMGVSEFWEVVFRDFVTIGLALPSLLAAVFAAMWFGVSDVTPMVASAAISFPFLAQSVYSGVKDLDYRLVEMANSFDISSRRLIRRIVGPSILPEWFGGLRYSFAICWKITTLAELVVAENGVGFMIRLQMQRLSLEGVLAWTFLFTLLILILEYGLMQRVERRAFGWREETSLGWGA